MRLSRHFTLDELTVSQTAARLGLDNEPPAAAVVELQRLCELVLQPLRDSIGKPVVISSGYRSPEVNRAVGGAVASDHLVGRAADLIVPGVPIRRVCARIAELRLPFRQLIDEFGPSGWVHVAIPARGDTPARQMLAARRGSDGRTQYAQADFLRSA